MPYGAITSALVPKGGTSAPCSLATGSTQQGMMATIGGGCCGAARLARRSPPVRVWPSDATTPAGRASLLLWFPYAAPLSGVGRKPADTLALSALSSGLPCVRRMCSHRQGGRQFTPVGASRSGGCWSSPSVAALAPIVWGDGPLFSTVAHDSPSHDRDRKMFAPAHSAPMRLQTGVIFRPGWGVIGTREGPAASARGPR